MLKMLEFFIVIKTKIKGQLNAVLLFINMKRLFFILFTLNFLNTGAQGTLTIIDSISKQAVKDVYLCRKSGINIKVLSITNEEGKLEISGNTISKDSLFLSHVSYQTKWLTGLNIHSNSTIEVSPLQYSLKDISVSTFKTTQTQVVGYYNEKGKEFLCAANPGWIIGCVINIDTIIKRYKISKLFCEFEKIDFVISRKSRCRTGIIFHFLKVKNGIPINEDAADPLIFDYGDLRNKFKKNINFSLPVENTDGQIFVGVEWQSLPCLAANETFKRFDLPIKYTPSDIKVWTLDTKSGRWMKSKGALTDGRPGISLEIKY